LKSVEAAQQVEACDDDAPLFPELAHLSRLHRHQRASGSREGQHGSWRLRARLASSSQ